MTGALGARRLTLAFSALGFVGLLAGPALAQTELLPENTLQNPVKKAKQVVKKVIEKADETVQETQETVDEAVEETKETVKETEKEVRRIVDGVIQPDSPEPDKPRPSADDRPNNESDDPGPRVKSNSRHETESPTGPRVVRPATDREPVERPELQPVRAAPTERRPSSIAAPAPGEVAQRLAFPLLMIAIVIAFLVFQGKFDRRDPKLQFNNDLDGERLSFE